VAARNSGGFEAYCTYILNIFTPTSFIVSKLSSGAINNYDICVEVQFRHEAIASNYLVSRHHW